MYSPNYLKAILIYVKDKETGHIHIVGTDQHDRLYLDDSGNIQYLNLQNGGSTEGDYEFVLDEQGHNQNDLTFTKEEQEKYGLINMDDYFNSLDLETYMELETKKRIQELTEINMRLVTEKIAKEKQKMWIRSQNKKILSKVNEALICTMDDNKYFIEGFWNRGSDTLGIYSSEEKAFAVLDEIQRAVESAKVYSTNRVSNVYSMSNEYVAVYQMPADEDVEV